MMLISDNVNSAFFWRLVSVFGYCFFDALWIYITFLFENKDEKKYGAIVKSLAYVPAAIFFIGNILVEPSIAMTKQYYGWVDADSNSFIQIAYGLWGIIADISGLIILFLKGKHTNSNRVRKQIKIILITSFFSVIIGIITDFVLPTIGVIVFPSAVLIGTIALGGACYSMNKYRMMFSTSKYISEYVFDAANEPIFVLSEEFNFQNCNKAALNIINYKFHELEGKKFSKLIYCDNLNFNSVIENSYVTKVEVNLQKKDGSCITCELSSTIIYDEYNDKLGILILLRDVSERKRISEIERNYTLKLEETNLMLKNQIKERIHVEEKLLHYVYYDPLTELTNRKKMLENLNNLLESQDKSFAILFIDLDGFKHINDNFGHQVGDMVLKEVAAKLKNVIGSNDTISRIGGDEFIIILTNIKSKSYIKNISSRIQEVLKIPFVYNGEQLSVGASIGISIAPEHGEDSDTLIRKADLAMYEVKRSGGYDYSVYSSKMKNQFIDKMEIKMKINKALENNEFIIYYQPIMDLKSMKVLNSEALIRWKQGEKIIPPVEFIPIAKSVGEIISIDNWMMENACIQCVKWNEAGLDEISVSVNTSYSQLKQYNFISIVKSILEAYSVQPKHLNLEITEDEAMEDLDAIINILEQIKDIGINISLDDFGTGYSSFSYLNKLPIDKIKIDKSLITDLEKDYKNIMIIKAIITMGHSLNMKIVAEGIETEKQLKILKDLECDYIQGYLIGKPMSASDFEKKFINQKVNIIEA